MKEEHSILFSILRIKFRRMPVFDNTFKYQYVEYGMRCSTYTLTTMVKHILHYSKSCFHFMYTRAYEGPSFYFFLNKIFTNRFIYRLTLLYSISPSVHNTVLLINQKFERKRYLNHKKFKCYLFIF